MFYYFYITVEGIVVDYRLGLGLSLPLKRGPNLGLWTTKGCSTSLGPFIRGKISRVLHKTRTFRVNGTFRLK